MRLIGIGMGLATIASAASAAPDDLHRYSFSIPPQPLASALKYFALQSGQQLVFEPAIVRGLQSSPLQGRYTAREGLETLLSKGGITARSTLGGFILMHAAMETPQSADPVLAQPAEPTEQQASEIIVTAQRRPQRLTDVAIAITNVSADEIASHGVSRAEDLAKLVPGFSVTDTGQNTPIYTLRGVGFNETSISAGQTVAIYVDEVPLAYPVMARGAILDIARIEVLKGPQGLLYGQSSTGGAINYIAAHPRDDAEAGGTISYGRFGLFDGSAYVSGPIASGLTGRVALQTAQGGAWQHSNSRPGDRLGTQHMTRGRALLHWNASDRLEIELNLNGWVDKSDSQAYQVQQIAFQSPSSPLVPMLRQRLMVSPFTPLAADWDGDVEPQQDDRFYQASLRASFNLGDAAKLTSISAYSNYRTDAVIDRDGTPLRQSLNRFDGRIQARYQEVRLSGTVAPVDYLLGLNYRDDHVFDQLAFESGQASNAFIGTRFRSGSKNLSDQDITAKAAFANLDWHISDDFTTSAGARYSTERRGGKSCTADPGDGSLAAIFRDALINPRRVAAGLAPIAPIPAGACLTILTNPPLEPGFVVRKLDEDNVSWRLAANWKPLPRSQIFVSISKGYKPGTFATLAGTNEFQYEPVKQESVLSYEVGARLSTLANKVNWSGSLFYYDYRDKQLRGRTQDPVFGVLVAMVNVPKARIKGAEGEISVGPIGGITLRASGVYVDARIVDFTGFNELGVRQDFAGERINFTPKYSANLGADYDRPLNEKLRLEMGAYLSYRSATSAFFGNLPVNFIAPFTLIDAHLGVASADGRWKAHIFGRNVTNKYYWTNVVRSGDVLVRTTGRPATFGVSLGFSL